MWSGDSLPRWKELYTAAILELDKAKLLPRILAAKMAVCDRAEELNGRGDVSERAALNSAMKALCELQSLYFGASDDRQTT